MEKAVQEVVFHSKKGYFLSEIKVARQYVLSP